VAVALSIVLALYDIGPRSAQMLLHIALMNVAAPLAALLLSRSGVAAGPPKALWGATILQLVLLWAWHVPALNEAAAGSHGLHLLMQEPCFSRP
jgi:putative membrane protein